MFSELRAQIDTMSSADCIKEGFCDAINYAKRNPKISRARFSWYCGLFWSGAKYDIILYD
jgi:hypothetical protein